MPAHIILLDVNAVKIVSAFADDSIIGGMMDSGEEYPSLPQYLVYLVRSRDGKWNLILTCVRCCTLVCQTIAEPPQ